jgi:hypothetical protein
MDVKDRRKGGKILNLYDGGCTPSHDRRGGFSVGRVYFYNSEIFVWKLGNSMKDFVVISQSYT